MLLKILRIHHDGFPSYLTHAAWEITCLHRGCIGWGGGGGVECNRPATRFPELASFDSFFVTT